MFTNCSPRPERCRPPQEYGKVIVDIVLAQRLRPGTPSATRLGTVVADLLLYEGKIRSLQGPDAARVGWRWGSDRFRPQPKNTCRLGRIRMTVHDDAAADGGKDRRL